MKVNVSAENPTKLEAEKRDRCANVGNGAVETVTNAAPGVTQRYYRLIEQ